MIRGAVGPLVIDQGVGVRLIKFLTGRARLAVSQALAGALAGDRRQRGGVRPRYRARDGVGLGAFGRADGGASSSGHGADGDGRSRAQRRGMAAEGFGRPWHLQHGGEIERAREWDGHHAARGVHGCQTRELGGRGSSAGTTMATASTCERGASSTVLSGGREHMGMVVELTLSA